MRISLTNARKRLPQLIKSAALGKVVTICRRGVAVVDLVPVEATTKRRKKKIKFGTLKGKIKIIDPDWWKPMTDEEVEAFLDGRY